MKRIFYSATALCALFALSSCSNDDAPINDMGNDGVSFRIVVPSSLATRATFGDESTVSLNNLQWSVFDMSDENAPSLVFSNADKSAFQSSQSYETVNLQLVKGNRYQVVFYADNQENTFVTCENGVINVDYSQAVPNVANEDAFVGKSGIFTVSDKGQSETVTLRRPFAQLNWGSDDLKAESVKPLLDNLTATVRISSPIYTTMDILSGNLGGETERQEPPYEYLRIAPYGSRLVQHCSRQQVRHSGPQHCSHYGRRFHRQCSRWNECHSGGGHSDQHH